MPKDPVVPKYPRGNRTLLICDPMCVLPYGHNVASVHYFYNILKTRFSKVFCLGCESLPRDAADAFSITNFYHYYYSSYISLSQSTAAATANDLSQSTYSPVDSLIADKFEALAVQDSVRALTEYDIHGDDAVFFPSADFYGVVGMLNALIQRDISTRPCLYLRFIGVMETASKLHINPFDDLLALISHSIEAGTRIVISAETPAYADYLSAKIGRNVAVIPYPLTSAFLPFNHSPPFVVSSLGSGRHDKGFFDLLSILSLIRERDQDLNIRFVVQSLPYRDLAANLAYSAQLYAMPGLDLLPPTISISDMRDAYRRSHIILLPYDSNTYKYRGSAILMEAVAVGRPVLTFPNTGFADQVSYYGMGRICRTPEEFAEAVFSYYRLDVEQMTTIASQSRSRFALDLSASHETFIK
jgi:glycosyltransferase involved in cell wall biosynthesis